MLLAYGYHMVTSLKMAHKMNWWESGNEGKEDKRKDSKVVLSCDLLVYELQVLWHPNFRS